MGTRLVGYDLNSPGRDYESLIDRLKQLAPWWHHLDSTWLVTTTMSAKELRDNLKPLIDSDDELLVIDVDADAAAWTGFNDKGSKWIKENL